MLNNKLQKILAGIQRDMYEALEEFGSYSFFDKGPDEVMYTAKWIKSIKQLSSNDARLLLETLQNCSEAGAVVANHFVLKLQKMPDDWFEDLISGDLEY